MKTTPNTFPEKEYPAGFALVATISVMALLVMIALAMLSLSTITLRASKNGKAMAEAKANARLALMIAIGELQKSAGPDQRITANADILAAGTVEQSQILGVWDSIGVNPEGSDLTDTKDLNALAEAYEDSYTDKTRGNRFRKWLISGGQTTVQEDITYPQSAVSADAIPLIGAHTLGSLDEASITPELQRKLIKAELVNIQEDATTTGRYAWAVTGENLKAHVNLTAPTGSGGDSERIVQRVGSSLNAIQVMNDTQTFGSRFIDAAGDLSPDLKKAISVGSLRLAGYIPIDEAALGAFYSDLSVSSSGLLTDAKWGGWKKDLSLLAERASLPSELALSMDSTAQVFSGSIGSPVTDSPSMAHGPYWEDLWSYLRSYKPFDDGGLVEWDGSSPYYSVGPNWDAAVTRRGWQMRTPVLSKYMWLFSFQGVAATDAEPGFKQLNMITQPIIELWNPFNLPLEMPKDSQFDFALRTLPVSINIYQDEIKLSSGRTNHIFSSNTDDDTLMANYAISFENDVRLAPGENGLYSDGSEEPELVVSSKIDLERGLNIMGGVLFEKLDAKSEKVFGPLFYDTSKPIEITYTRPGDGTLLSGSSFHSRTFFTNISGTESSQQSELLIDQGGKESIFEEFGEGGFTFTPGIVPTPSLIYGAIMKTEIPITATFPPIDPITKTESEDTKFSHHLYSALSIGRSYIGPAPEHKEMLETSPFAYFGRRVNDYDTLPISLSANGENGKQGRSTGANGQSYMPTRELPIQPLTSMAQLQHAGLGDYHIAWDFQTTTTGMVGSLENGHLVSHPQVNFAFGNSYASPFVTGNLIEAVNARSPMGQRDMIGLSWDGGRGPGQLGYITTLHDKSWKANEALWDEWFLSGIGDWTNPLAAESRSKSSIINDFTDSNEPLPNSRYTPDVDDSATAKANIDSDDGYTKIARYISSQGSFNVNSTSKYAWKAVLGGLDRKTADLIYLDLLGNVVKDSDTMNQDGYAFSRFTLPTGQSTASTGDSQGRYRGARKLSDTELDRLADRVVEEVKLRGPFLSLSEFMNRRLATDDDDLAKRGALQAAIDKAQLNQVVEADGDSILVPELLGTYTNPNALKSYDGISYDGPLYTATGAPSHLSQADILMSIAPSLTVRCDTFTIRSYGDSLDSQGKVVARAWCEAIVKRQPEYVDTTDATDKQVVDLEGNISPLSTVNQQHGRKMEIVSFRWLSKDEI